ncbi:TRAP transporter small permease [Bacillus sp. FJAT-29814]|uniref:TRAP transporter small permease n=1 Tax=Bacillus sp. FJAT-29814 TaxID=1729688 RepID=UPI000829DDBF|nr:TRAP transporter small permease [Bacillus sp. FJAT-29814]
MKKLDNIIVKVIYVLCASLMGLMAVVITAQVLSRYILGSPLTWSEELGRFTFVWISFLGMAVGINKGSHIALDLLVTKLKGVSKKVLLAINNALVSIFGILFTYSGFLLVELGARQTSPSLNLPMNLVYIVIPISGIILVYFVISETVQMFQRKEDTV